MSWAVAGPDSACGGLCSMALVGSELILRCGLLNLFWDAVLVPVSNHAGILPNVSDQIGWARLRGS